MTFAESGRRWNRPFGFCRFPSSTEHLILNEHVSTLHNVRSHKIQTQLNMIHPEIFPQLQTCRTTVAGPNPERTKHLCHVTLPHLTPRPDWLTDTSVSFIVTKV